MATEAHPPVTWIRKQTHPGTEYRAKDGRVIVRAIEWKRPGMRDITSRGWIVDVDGEREGPAFRTAKKAMEYAELPGVYRRIAGTIERHDREKRTSFK